MDKKRTRTRPDLMLSIVTPVYQEGENIEKLLTEIQKKVFTPFELLVVYDFEEDNTIGPVKKFQQTSKMPLTLIKNDHGPGVLNAMKTGIHYAEGKYVIVTMADLCDPPELFDQMVELALKEGADVVSPSRYMKGGTSEGAPWIKGLLSKWAGLSLYHLAGIATHDATNNFKLYSKRFLSGINIESVAGFELALELTVKAHHLGLKIVELPTHWKEREAGESKFKLWKWLPHYLRWYRLGWMRQAPRDKLIDDTHPATS